MVYEITLVKNILTSSPKCGSLHQSLIHIVLLQMSNADEALPTKFPTVTAKDFVDYVRGQATSDQDRLVRAALRDENSELNAWLKGIEAWTKDALPVTSDPATGHKVRQTGAMEKLNALCEFVHQKRDAKLLAEEESTKIFAAGGLDRIEQFPRTPAQAIAAIGRMTAIINESHPEFASEIAKLSALRSR